MLALVGCIDPAASVASSIDVGNGAFRSMAVHAAGYTRVDISRSQDRHSYARGINDAGVVTGYAYLATDGSQVAFIRWPDGTRFDFGKRRGAIAFAINARNQGAGFFYASSGAAHAAIFTAPERIQDLGTARPISVAYGINASGFVVGETVFEANQPQRAFLWSPRTQRMRDLRTPGRFSRAYDINDEGVVVGQDDFAFAFRWTAAGGVVFLPSLGGNAAAYAINNRGAIVGYSLTTNGQSHAVLWPASGGIIDLGTLGGWNSWASDINDAGHIVGSSELTPLGAFHAFVMPYPGPMIDLSGSSGNATAVNGCGLIAGSMSIVGGDHATLWVPDILSAETRSRGRC